MLISEVNYLNVYNKALLNIYIVTQASEVIKYYYKQFIMLIYVNQ